MKTKTKTKINTKRVALPRYNYQRNQRNQQKIHIYRSTSFF